MKAAVDHQRLEHAIRDVLWKTMLRHMLTQKIKQWTSYMIAQVIIAVAANGWNRVP
jgi:hypothetical protein